MFVHVHVYMHVYIYMYMYKWYKCRLESGLLWVRVPPEASNFSLKNNCFGQLCCVVLPCLSNHLMDD